MITDSGMAQLEVDQRVSKPGARWVAERPRSGKLKNARDQDCGVCDRDASGAGEIYRQTGATRVQMVVDGIGWKGGSNQVI